MPSDTRGIGQRYRRKMVLAGQRYCWKLQLRHRWQRARSSLYLSAAYARAMSAVIRKHGAEVLNVSVRHSPADRSSLLPWAKGEVFSFVVYYSASMRLRGARPPAGRAR